MCVFVLTVSPTLFFFFQALLFNLFSSSLLSSSSPPHLSISLSTPAFSLPPLFISCSPFLSYSSFFSPFIPPSSAFLPSHIALPYSLSPLFFLAPGVLLSSFLSSQPWILSSPLFVIILPLPHFFSPLFSRSHFFLLIFSFPPSIAL